MLFYKAVLIKFWMCNSGKLNLKTDLHNMPRDKNGIKIKCRNYNLGNQLKFYCYLLLITIHGITYNI